MVEKSLSEWAENGLGKPSNVYSGFGNDSIKTYEVRFAGEVVDRAPYNGYVYDFVKVGKVGESIDLLNDLDGLNVSTITGMPFVGWSFRHEDHDTASYELDRGEKFKLTYPGVVTLFPAFEEYEFYPSDPLSRKVTQSCVLKGSSGKSVTVDVPVYIENELAPGIDISKCAVFYTVSYSIAAVFEKKRPREVVGATTLTCDKVGQLVWPNTATESYMVVLQRNIPAVYNDPSLDHISRTYKLSKNNDRTNATVTITSYISAWTLYPKRVYNPPQPDEHPSGG